MVNKCKTNFHKQALSSWTQIFVTELESHIDIINQFLVNKSLMINRKCIMLYFFRAINSNVTYNIRILNILSQQNTFINLEDFNKLNQTNIDTLEYNALKSCIPKSWKRKFLENYNAAEVKPIEQTIQINNPHSN